MSTTPPPTPPATAGRTASPARSLRQRMGTAMRRASTGLAFSRPTTPFRSESRSSLRLDAALAPSAQEAHVPSPVQESPVREAAAAESNIPAAPIGPSPLAAAVVSAPEETPAASESAPPVTVSIPEPEPEVTSQPVQPPEVSAQMPVSEPAPQGQGGAVPAAVPEALVAVVPATPEPVATAAPVERQQSTSVAQESTSAPPVPAPAAGNQIIDRAVDFFSWKDDQIAAQQKSQETHAQMETASPEAMASVELPAVREQPQAATEPPAPAPQVSAPAAEPAPIASNTTIDDHAQAFAWKDEPALAAKRSAASIASEMIHPVDEARETRYPSRSISPRGSKSSMASSYGHVMINAPGRRVSISVGADDDDIIKRGRSNSIRNSIRNSVR